MSSQQSPRIPTAEQRVIDAFNGYFANWDIRIEHQDVALGSHRIIFKRGWRIIYRVDPDDAGFPSLEFYATHRMTNDRHVRIWADGHVDRLDAMHDFYHYNPKVPGAEQAAKEEYLRHNRAIAKELRARGRHQCVPEGRRRRSEEGSNEVRVPHRAETELGL